MRRARQAGFGTLGLGIGRFPWYTPDSGPVKAVSSGLLPTPRGSAGRRGLRPASAPGTMAASPTIVRQWHDSGHRRVGRPSVFFPVRQTAMKVAAPAGGQRRPGQPRLPFVRGGNAIRSPGDDDIAERASGATKSAVDSVRNRQVLVRHHIAEVNGQYVSAAAGGV